MTAYIDTKNIWWIPFFYTYNETQKYERLGYTHDKIKNGHVTKMREIVETRSLSSTAALCGNRYFAVPAAAARAAEVARIGVSADPLG